MTVFYFFAARLAGCMLLIGLCLAARQAAAQIQPDRNKALPAAVEKELAAFIDECVPAKRMQLLDHMDAAVDVIHSTVALSGEETRALKNDAAKIVDASIEAWRPCVIEVLRAYLIRWPATVSLRQITQWKRDETAVKEPVEGWRMPDEEPAWIAAVKARLDGPRFDAWRTVADEAARRKEAEIASWIEAWREESRNHLSGRIESKIGQLPEDLTSARETDQFKKAGKTLVDRLIAAQEKRAFAMLRSIPDAVRREISENGQFQARFNFIAAPNLDQVWEAELKQTLSEKKFAAWRQWVAEEKAKFDKELPVLFKPRLDQMQELWQRTLEMVAADVRRLANLPEERTKELEPAIKTALQSAERAWMRLVREQASSLDLDQLENAISNGGFYIVLEDEDAPQNGAVWNEAVRKWLSAEEWRQLEAAKKERRNWRLGVATLALIAELDQKVALTSLQRQALEPIAERLVKEVPEFFREYMPMYGYEIRPQLFYSAAKNVNEGEMMALLDQVQWNRWQDVSRAQAKPSPVVKGDQAPAQEELEAADLEKRVSDYLYGRSKLERRRSLSEMLLRTEDASRVTGVPDRTVLRLQLAAKGAVERCMVGWNTRTEQIVRGQLQGATPQNVQQRLEALQEYDFSQRDVAAPASDVIWTGTVKNSLNEAQRAAWQKEIDARRAYWQQSVAALVVAEFDRRYSLTHAQAKKLVPMIVHLIAEYHEDIQSYFSSSVPWYMQSYSCLLPFAGLPEAELKAVIDKRQFDSWAGEGLANTAQYWDSIQSNHRQKAADKK